MWSGIIAGAGALLGGLSGSSGAKKAAKEQAAATRAALAEEQRQFDLNRSDIAPWRETGGAALGKMRDLLGMGDGQMSTEDLMKLDPGYQFGLQEGNKAIENAARARGMFMSPSTVKELLRYGTDYASTKFGDVYNRFAGLAGTGQTAALGGAQLGSGSTGRMSDLISGLGNARGASAIAQGNAWGGAAQNFSNWYSNQRMFNQLMGGGGGTSQNPSWMQGYTNPYATVQN